MIVDLRFLLPVLAFALASSITPGPNTLMIMASSTNHGYVRTLPHILGVTLGFPLMLIALGLGLNDVFTSHPWVYDVLKYLCIPALLWIAWLIASARAPQHPQDAGGRPRSHSARPFRMYEAMLFQWINLKAWLMALSAISLYTRAELLLWPQVLAIAICFSFVILPCCSAWALSGLAIRRLLRSPLTLRLFNGTMAALLLASMLPALIAG